MKELTLKQLKRRDVRDLKNAGVYNNGREYYLDTDGHHRTDLEIPAWFHNMTKAWQVKKLINEKRKRAEVIASLSKEEKALLRPATLQQWNDSCDERISHGFPDPREKKVVHRVKRSDMMRVMLAEHGIAVLEDNTIDGFEGFSFMPNGRIKYVDFETGEETKYSTHWFINNMI